MLYENKYDNMVQTSNSINNDNNNNNKYFLIKSFYT